MFSASGRFQMPVAFGLIGIQNSSSEVGSLFLYLGHNTSKCGRLSSTYSEAGNQEPKMYWNMEVKTSRYGRPSSFYKPSMRNHRERGKGWSSDRGFRR